MTATTRSALPWRRRAALLVAALVAGLVGVGLPTPAQSAEWTVLCTGYDACNAAGYPDSGYKAKASTSWWSQSTGHNCTNYVAYRLVQNGLVNKRPAQLSGNAFNWGLAFADQTNDAPAVGSIAWWGQTFSSTGHIAYVEKVVSANEILVSEDNWGGDFRWRRVTRAGGLWPNGFIHLKDLGASTAAPAAYGDYRPVTPARLMDTRSSLGGSARLAAGGDVSLLVAGRAGLPKTPVGSVVVNVTAVNPAATGYLTVYPSGTPLPATSSVNYVAGSTVANQVITAVGQDGRIRIRSSQAADVLVDVAGWYPAFGHIVTMPPRRVLDTRTGTGAPQGAVTGGRSIDLGLAGQSGIPSSGVAAVILNTTAANPASSGYATTWPAGTTRPTTSTLNYQAPASAAALGVPKLGPSGAVSLFPSGTTDLVGDVTGWFPSGADYTPIVPARLADTRYATPVTRPDGGSTVVVGAAGRGGVPATGATAVMLTVTVVNPTDAGYVSVYPDGMARPTVSAVNFAAGQTIANSILARVGPSGAVDVYTSAGADVIVDVQGWVG